MAKLQDKFFNRVIEGNLELEANEQKQVNDLAEAKAEEVIQAGETSNAKPIYCHPIALVRNVDQDTRLTCLIFNNDPTPFTKNTFVAWLQALHTEIGEVIRIMTSGAYIRSNNDIVIASYMGVNNEGRIYITGIKTTGDDDTVVFASDSNFIDFFDQFNDGVNKIN